jgi:hypothetical protein
MKTFKYYLSASSHFLQNSTNPSLDSEEKEYFQLVSLLLSWIGLESYVNSIFDSLSVSTRLKPHEKSFLDEKELKVSDDGVFIESTIRPSTCKKLLFIINYFSRKKVSAFKQTRLWLEIKNFEDLRNKIVPCIQPVSATPNLPSL